jgi:hypothetical protein
MSGPTIIFSTLVSNIDSDVTKNCDNIKKNNDNNNKQ